VCIRNLLSRAEERGKKKGRDSALKLREKREEMGKFGNGRVWGTYPTTLMLFDRGGRERKKGPMLMRERKKKKRGAGRVVAAGAGSRARLVERGRKKKRSQAADSWLPRGGREKGGGVVV